MTECDPWAALVLVGFRREASCTWQPCAPAIGKGAIRPVQAGPGLPTRARGVVGSEEHLRFRERTTAHCVSRNPDGHN